MYWNHRVFQTEDYEYDGVMAYAFEVREVYYDSDTDKIIGWTAGSTSPYGESLEHLKENLAWFLDACSKPVLVVDPQDENKLIGVELGKLDYDEEEYTSYSSVEELLEALDNDSESGDT